MELIRGNSHFLNKKMKLLSFIMISCILPGCGKDMQALQSEEMEGYEEEAQEVSIQESFEQEVPESPYYRIYQGSAQEDSTYYYYDLLDEDGEVVCHECTYFAEPEISEVSEQLIRVSAQPGEERGTGWTYFYDRSKNDFSKTYYYMLDQKDHTIAYFDGEQIVVSDLFDGRVADKRIVLDWKLAGGAESVKRAEFSSDLSYMRVTYIEGKEHKTVNEIVDLMQVEGVNEKAMKLPVEHPYYRIYQGSTQEDHFCFYYDLFDADGKQVCHECTYMSQPHISEVSDHVIRISAQAGTGRGCIWFYYYDVIENQSSTPHDYPLAQKDPLVAYFDGGHVVVSDLFDQEKYYKEIVLNHTFSNTIEPVLGAQFTEDLSHLIVLYEAGEEGKIIREIVDL